MLPKKHLDRLKPSDKSRVIEMAWEDRTPFEAIETLYRLTEAQVIDLMRQALKHKSFKNWRTRVSGRKTKHLKIRSDVIGRSHCPSQYKVKSATKTKR
ncbi:TIGR03643 family protein [Colwelliaceae bacterium BS250]